VRQLIPMAVAEHARLIARPPLYAMLKISASTVALRASSLVLPALILMAVVGHALPIALLPTIVRPVNVFVFRFVIKLATLHLILMVVQGFVRL